MCIDAPESTTNFLSSGAGRHRSSVSEKKVDLCFSFSFMIFLASLHAASRARRLAIPSLFLRPIVKFWRVGVSLMRITCANHSKRRILVSNVCMTQHGFGELNNGLASACLSSSSKSMKTSAARGPEIRSPIVVRLST